uniref:Regulator of G protein signaling 14 n=1 Tax=Varanus komodoensis TaxID=61221 RepID=A0A8D2LIG8_VARKO
MEQKQHLCRELLPLSFVHIPENALTTFILLLQGLAVSDGGKSKPWLCVNSLPSTQSVTHSLGQSVARWAESFETLLQDHLGVAYFTEFLKKEFSAENVYFWQACERFQQIPATSTQQLAQEARCIYDEFLSSHSVNPVNIDRQAWIGEEMLADPTPDMFNVQQLQIFNLMKFDSYARFVKSPLYQACARAESQGQPLPELRPHSQSGSPPTDHGKVQGQFSSRLTCGVAFGEFKGEGPSQWRESQGSLNSSASLDLGFLSSCNHRKSLTGSESDNQNQPIKYCCIYLPDGTASLAPVRAGLSIQEMLVGICERRGLHPPDVKIYLVGNEKKPLALNQESLVLMDQEVRLETRISFDLEIVPINKTVRILAKSTKHLREALQPILEKYGLDVTRVLLRRPGDPRALNMEEKVSSVAAQKLVLESDAGTWCCARSTLHFFLPPFPTPHSAGLVELLNRVQSCRVNDQRGLLSKEDLVLPEFLQVQIPSSTHDPPMFSHCFLCWFHYH